MTTPAADDAIEPVPVPVRVVLPADPPLGTEQQEVVARLWKRRQTQTGWLYLVGLPSYRDLERAVASVDALLNEEPHLPPPAERAGCVRPSASPRHLASGPTPGPGRGRNRRSRPASTRRLPTVGR